MPGGCLHSMAKIRRQRNAFKGLPNTRRKPPFRTRFFACDACRRKHDHLFRGSTYASIMQCLSSCEENPGQVGMCLAPWVCMHKTDIECMHRIRWLKITWYNTLLPSVVLPGLLFPTAMCSWISRLSQSWLACSCTQSNE